MMQFKDLYDPGCWRAYESGMAPTLFGISVRLADPIVESL